MTSIRKNAMVNGNFVYEVQEWVDDPPKIVMPSQGDLWSSSIKVKKPEDSPTDTKTYSGFSNGGYDNN